MIQQIFGGNWHGAANFGGRLRGKMLELMVSKVKLSCSSRHPHIIVVAYYVINLGGKKGKEEYFWVLVLFC